MREKYRTKVEYETSAAPLIDLEEYPGLKTNYLTDDSESDLDVIVDPIKTQVPKNFKVADLKSNQSLKEMRKTKP